ncbi:MAG: ankyrin repeat domain-containing protein, partial [Hydrogenophaga sp.]|nr:ankyrin repeat domain-containing protein [Hydrogenophaga sp.]
AALSSRRAAAPAPSPDAALLAAAARGTLAEARDALAQGADVNGSDASGRTALMRAALRGDAALVRLLLEAGADPQRSDRDGLRAADLAQRAGHGALLPLLEPGAPR